MVETGGRFRLGAKALHVVGRRQRTGQQHLEGDAAIEAFLPRPKDDAHAAAGDFFEIAVIAEVAHGRHGGNNTSQRRRQAVEAILILKELAQVGSEIGMRVEQLLPRRRGAVPHRVEIHGQDLIEALFAVAFGVERRGHGGSWSS